MSRFLFVVPPLTGHVNPTVGMAQQLVQAGHDVAWVGHASRVQRLLPRGAELMGLDDRKYAELEAGFLADSQKVRLLQSLVFLWERFLVPLCRLMVPGVEAAVERFGPDVLVVDQQALAGAVVARQQGLRWATVATSAADALDLEAPGSQMIRDFIHGQLAVVQKEHGLTQVNRLDNSEKLVVVCSTRELFGDREYPEAYRFVGPCFADRPEHPFPWEALRDEPRVLVSLGTVSPDRGERFFRTVVEALGGEALQVILVAPEGVIEEAPDNFIVRDYVPQLRLLEHVTAVVCHAGHGTAAEALFRGLPLVMTPIRDDQPIVASLVVQAGAGLRLKFGRLKAAGLREAVRRVLEEPEFGEAAAKIGASFEQAGGAERAAALLAGLAAGDAE